MLHSFVHPERPVTLADFTSSSLMLPRLRGDGPAAAIKELSQALQAQERVPDLLPFYQAALNREFMVSTNIESGMAFPHARVPGLKEVSFALGRSEESLRWGSNCDASVRFVFLLAVPATDATKYLLVRSGLARLARDSGLVEGLRSAVDAISMMAILHKVGLRPAPALERTRTAVL